MKVACITCNSDSPLTFSAGRHSLQYQSPGGTATIIGRAHHVWQPLLHPSQSSIDSSPSPLPHSVHVTLSVSSRLHSEPSLVSISSRRRLVALTLSRFMQSARSRVLTFKVKWSLVGSVTFPAFSFVSDVRETSYASESGQAAKTRGPLVLLQPKNCGQVIVQPQNRTIPYRKKLSIKTRRSC